MNPTIKLSNIYVGSPLWDTQYYDRSPLPALPQEFLNSPIQYTQNQRQYVELSAFPVCNIESKLAFLPGIINVFHTVLGLKVKNSSESEISVGMDLSGNENNDNPIFLSDDLHYLPSSRLRLNRPLFLRPDQSTDFFINSNFLNQSDKGTSLTITVKLFENLKNVVEIKSTAFIGSHSSEAIKNLFTKIKGSPLERVYYNTCPEQNQVQNQIQPIQNVAHLLRIFSEPLPKANQLQPIQNSAHSPRSFSEPLAEAHQLQPIIDPVHIIDIFREPTSGEFIDLYTPK